MFPGQECPTVNHMKHMQNRYRLHLDTRRLDLER